MRIGCHLSTGAGFSRAVANAGRLGAEVFQYFPKNPKSYRIKRIDAQAWAKDRELARHAGLVTVAHSAYVTNLSTADPTLLETTIASIVNELQIAEAYGTPWLVVHCGKHLGEGPQAGMRRMAEAVEEVMARYQGPCHLLLENTAGQGTELGRTVDELIEIRGRMEQPRRVGFCLDTCHAFAAGLLAPDAFDQFVCQVSRPEFMAHLEVLHLNDSQGGPGDRLDRHALLGRGRMEGLLRQVLQEPAFGDLPVVIETPVAQEDDYAAEIRLARAWARGEQDAAESISEQTSVSDRTERKRPKSRAE